MERTLGPYRLLSELGRGGMGIVHAAVHERSGERVAVKTAIARDEATRESLRREIHALARLAHPGIVKVLQVGLHDPLPWYAMEVVESVPMLRDWRLAGSTPAGLAELLGVVARLCDTLAFLHGEGFVHRDLKPANVLVRPGGEPVLVDFGIAFQSEVAARERLRPSGTSVGTYAYTSPEQLRGDPVDARADLYAVGVILYELATGLTPFPGGNVQEVMEGHLRRAPIPPSAFRALPRELDDLVLELLAKDPRSRPGFADEVAGRLRALGAPPPVGGAPPTRPYLYRPCLVGRRDAVARLEGMLASLDAGAGEVVDLQGTSGSGRTRLVLEIAREASRRGILVLDAGASRSNGSGALSTLRPLLRHIAERCRERGAAESAFLVGDRASVLARYEPMLARVPGASGAAAAELPDDASLERLHAYLTDCVRALATYRPILLLIDELHGPDELTAGWLAHLRRVGLARLPLLVLVTRRAGGEPPAESGSVWISALDDDEVAGMTRQMLARREESPGFRAALAAAAGGSPLFVTEYLQVALQEGVLVRRGSRWWVAAGAEATPLAQWTGPLPLPEALGPLVVRRLDGVSIVARAFLDASCLLDRAVDRALVAAATGLPSEALWEAESELLRLGLLREPSPGRLELAHDRLRDHLRNGLAPGNGRELHRRIAEAMGQRQGEEAVPEAELARHLEGAGLHARARDAYRAAARSAIARHAHLEAQRHMGAFLALVDVPDAGSVGVRLDLAESLALRGATREALAHHEEALQQAEALGSAANIGRSLRGQAQILRNTERARDAVALLERARATFRDAGHAAEEASVLGTLAHVNIELGRPDVAETLCNEALAAARGADDAEALADALGTLAALREMMGKPAEAHELFLETLRIERSRSDERRYAETLGNLAFLHREQGRMEEAERSYMEALQIHQRLGNRLGEGLMWGALATLAIQRGQPDEAVACYEKTQSIDREIGNLKGEGANASNMACLLMDRGRMTEAKIHLDRALEIARLVASRRLEGQVLGNLGIFYDDVDVPAEAARHYELALAIHRDVRNRRSEGIVLSNLANVRAKQGQLVEAQTLLDLALAIHREVGNRAFEAHDLGNSADLIRWAGGDLGEAAARIGRAVAIATELGDRHELGKLACQGGYVRLAAGASAREAMEEARAIATEVGAGPESELGRHVASLERAQEASGRGEALVGGLVAADVPPELLDSLRAPCPGTSRAAS